MVIFRGFKVFCIFFVILGMFEFSHHNSLNWVL